MAIIGAGYTGLWAAWYLKQMEPGLEIVILEAEIAGFGASGRNGGWCSAFLSGIDHWLDDPAGSWSDGLDAAEKLANLLEAARRMAATIDSSRAVRISRRCARSSDATRLISPHTGTSTRWNFPSAMAS